MDVLQNFHNFRVLWHGRTELPDFSGRYQNAVPVTRAFVALAYRTYRSSGCGYEITELEQAPGTGNTRGNAPPGGGVRFEVEDIIQLAWHVLTGGNPSYL